MMGLVMPASRSLIALLAGTAVFFALWIFALKPSSSSTGGGGSSSSQGLGAYQSDINKAHEAVGISNASNAASGNDSVSSTATASPRQTTTTGAHSSAPAAKPTATLPTATASKHVTQPTAGENFSTVQHAIDAHKVVAMLFYNAYATDDQAVKQELGSVPTHRGQVVKLSIPLSQAAAFTAVTQQVPLNLSPTLVLIAPNGQASEIVGYTTAFEISQRVEDALASS
jgi:hypothetical protein